MGETLRVAVGIMGNASSLLLYAAPILTFKRVIKKGSTEEYSCIPYIIALLNCLLYTWYGLPVVSRGWENLPVVSINGLGILFEVCFIVIYVWFALPERKKLVLLLIVPVMILFSMTVFVTTLMLHDHRHRKMFVGSVGLGASIAMYGSPLVAVKRVIKTKSVEFMPFYLSFFSFLSSSLWMAYGLLGRDLLLAAPNLLGSPMGLLQLAVYCIYRKRRENNQEPYKLDLERSGNKPTTQQLVVGKEAVKIETLLRDDE